MKWRTSDRQYPVLALGFNHRAESFFRCDAENPSNQNVIDARQRGLRKVRILHWATPEPIICKLVALLNMFHQGSAENHFDVMQEASVLNMYMQLDCFHGVLDVMFAKKTNRYC